MVFVIPSIYFYISVISQKDSTNIYGINNLHIFINDPLIFSSINSQEHQVKLPGELSKIEEWSKMWSLNTITVNVTYPKRKRRVQGERTHRIYHSITARNI